VPWVAIVAARDFASRHGEEFGESNATTPSARYQHLTSREHNKLTHAVITTGRACLLLLAQGVLRVRWERAGAIETSTAVPSGLLQ